MVAYELLSFPKSQSANGQLLGTVNVPYKSTDSLNKTLSLNVPVGFSFVGNVGTANPMTITVANMVKPSTISVYKNGVLITTTTNSNADTNATSKQFVLANTAGVVSFSSYFYNITFAYTPVDSGTVGVTDVYTFYAPLTFTMSSSSATPLSLIAGSWSYGVVTNTSVSTSTFSNFSYASGSSDSSNYTPYEWTSTFYTNDNWSNGNLNGYVPTTLYTLWTGLYQIMVLYVTKIYVTKSINFKNMGSTNVIQWFDSDTNGAVYLGLIYSSLSSGAMNFVVNAAKLTNGFIFNSAVSAPSLSIAGATTTNSLSVAGTTTTNALSVTGSTTLNSLTVTGALNFSVPTSTTSLKLNNTATIKGMACGYFSTPANGLTTVLFGCTFVNNPIVTTTLNIGLTGYVAHIAITNVTTTSFQYEVWGIKYPYGATSLAHLESVATIYWIAMGV